MTQAPYWTATGVAMAVALVAHVGDWLRVNRRRHIDHVGWVPWRAIQVCALFVSLATFWLALKG
jgi:hypothetical protein